jgi:hypothetical protein
MTMKVICDFCHLQESDYRGGVRCGAAKYESKDGYGPFKGGALCVHDSDLTDKFQPQEDKPRVNVRNLSSLNGRLAEERDDGRQRIAILESRLISIGETT